LPVAKGKESGEIRVTTPIDLTFEDGVLTKVSFNAVQLTVFGDKEGKLAVRSSFPTVSIGVI